MDEKSRHDHGQHMADITGTHRGGAELWSVVVDVGNINDRHTFACESLTRHVADLQPQPETFHHLRQIAAHFSQSSQG